MVISDLNFLAEITTGELAITKGGQTATPVNVRSQFRGTVLSLQTRNLLVDVTAVNNCQGVFDDFNEEVTFTCQTTTPNE